ncbi:unnamed protein product [Blepharisma stoltei]|uniref:Sec20 C-terminal domain-containing protein n=1 Tax=Blepharisma stoltei TaxID=1481888 RepID=A0AAU9JDQ5_9CILI|nr:unnamed protein product [Blepharisma stoltei]
MEPKSQSATDQLRDTHFVLHSELQRMNAISQTLGSTSKNYKDISDQYDDYGSEFSRAGKFLREMRRRISMQDVIFYVCFYIFLASAAWLFLKRFGVKTILSWFLAIFYYLLSYVFTYFDNETQGQDL